MAQADVDHLCHKVGTGPRHLCYKKASSSSERHLIYKSGQSPSVQWSRIIVSWDATGLDLDVCGYWTGYLGGKVGYGYHSRTDDGTYFSYWESDDNTSAGGWELILARIQPWSAQATRTYKVHFNFFGYDSEEYPGDRCEVSVTGNGQTLSVSNVPCGTRSGNKAETTDPGVTIEFDNSGTPLRITID